MSTVHPVPKEVYNRLMVELVHLKNRNSLRVEKREMEERIEVSFFLDSAEDCLLHWGLVRTPGSAWHLPPKALWPEGSREHGGAALQTPFESRNGNQRVCVRLDRNINYANIVFALFYPGTDRWDNNQGKNYHISLPVIKHVSSLPSVLNRETAGKEVLFEETFQLGDESELAAAVIREGDRYQVLLFSDFPGPLIFHWGAALRSRHEWTLPPAAMRPEGSEVFDDLAVRTGFVFRDGVNRLTLEFSGQEAPLGIPFVLRIEDEDRWLKNRNRNFFIPVAYSAEDGCPGPSGLAEEIINGETGNHGWTLMHRFNLCHDLIDIAGSDTEGLAMIYVWMRFSAIRQLDWQRRYNTQPRELSHAQDRLTLKISSLYIERPEAGDLLRLIMSTLGRGGEGQRIRDEILQIMHRHHIKEVSGHFMEEWHQKLHNNTTPDDIVICEAYLEFLRSSGDLDLFYKTLSEGGVSRERMEGFERPITTPPDFVPHLKEALIHDFENYLKLLKSIHSGTDLESAINAGYYLFDGDAADLLSSIWRDRETRGAGIVHLIEKITSIRVVIKELLKNERNSGRARDMLFLDFALEDFVRIIIERSIHEKPDGDQLVELIGMVLENIRFTYDNDELSQSSKEWNHLCGMPRFSRDWSLRAKAVLERVSRATGRYVDRYYELFQSKAEYLGSAFGVDSWTIPLFSEEVIRGMPVFVLSMLIRHLDPLLRRQAKLGDWQVVSPGRTAGWIEAAESLRSLQGRSYERPSIIIADKVMGDEEPPEGVTAIITGDTVDLVSHIAVRARNAGLLFATCYDADCIARLKSHEGRMLDLRVNVSGDVEFKEAEKADSLPSDTGVTFKQKRLPLFSEYAIASGDFNENVVGGKSGNLKLLENKLPDWVRLPVSVALPFGVFEKVCALDINTKVNERYRELLAGIDNNPEGLLDKIRSTILDLEAPEDLISGLRAVMNESGLGWPEERDEIWMCIKKVWASKWNERAYLSRRARNMRHEDIFMAVLIQEVVKAEYAFVIHTVNPSTRDRSELYAEVVPGLGETLVGNYPGRALGFISKKARPAPEILSYPSKSTGLFGGGLIFRSDSNAEDLPGYAGAGLYDSIMLEPPEEITLDYTVDPLVRDDAFRKEFLNSITKIGILIEERFGSPQDIEGAYADGKYYVVQTRPQVGTGDE